MPADHPLRAIRTLVDGALPEISPTLDALYASRGRPSIGPEYLGGNWTATTSSHMDRASSVSRWPCTMQIDRVLFALVHGMREPALASSQEVNQRMGSGQRQPTLALTLRSIDGCCWSCRFSGSQGVSGKWPQFICGSSEGASRAGIGIRIEAHRVTSSASIYPAS